MLRYKAKGFMIDKEAVIDLFNPVGRHPGVERLSISHFSLSSVASAPDIVAEIFDILRVGEETQGVSGQTGIETGSPRLIQRHMRGKCKPFSPEDWPDVVTDSLEILSENSWVPTAMLIIGLTREAGVDIDLTIRLVERLRGFKSLIVPIFFVAMGAFPRRQMWLYKLRSGTP